MKAKKLWSILLTFLCVAGLFLLVQPVKAVLQPRYEYGMTDGGIEIFGAGDVTGELTIPSTWNGYPVVAIGDSGFSYREGLTSVVIPEGVSLINSYAFSGCSALTSVSLPNSLRELCYGSFTDCPQLAFTVYGNGKYLGNSENPYLALIAPVSGATSVTVHKNTKVICEGFAYLETVKLSVETGNPYFSVDSAGVLFNVDKTVLYWTPAHLSGSYTVPAGVEKVCDSAFNRSDGLTAITMADSVKSIGSYAFSYLKELKTLYLGEQLEYIGENALYSCSGLTYSEYENGKYLGSAKNPYLLLVNVVDGSATEFRFHKETKVIASGAFSGAGGLTEVTVPDSIVGIGDNAFWRCSALTKLTLGKGVRSIGVALSRNCDQLTQIIVDDDNGVYSSHDGVLMSKDKTLLIQAPAGISGTYTVPDSVTRIAQEAFFMCKQLSGITFGKGVREIGKDAFNSCEGLTVLTVPGNVELIDEYAFYQCTGLTAVTLDEGVTVVERRAFYCCRALASVIFPDSLTTVGEEAFAATDQLTTVTIPKNVSRIGMDAFGYCSVLTGIHVAEANQHYSSHDGVLYDKAMTRLIQAPGGITQCVVPQGVKIIGENAFFECRKLKLVILPDSITTIERAAFYDCGLNRVIIPASVTQMEQSAFNGSIENVRFLGDVPEVIGDWEAITTSFYGSKINVYYPVGNATWADEASRATICAKANWAECRAYAITQGADVVITEENLSAVIGTAAESCYFMGLYLDGKWVAPENYTVTDETVITFCAEYLAKLKTGVHQVTLAFTDAEAKTTLTVKKELVGDLDGMNDVSEDDAIYLLQHVLMSDMFPVDQDVDFDKNGTVNEDDAIYLLQHVLMPETFPL